MHFQPNSLIIEPGHRLVVEAFSKLAGWRLVLRPARRRLFEDVPDVPRLGVELSKPAFGALIATDEPDGRPCLVFETDPISEGIREMYRVADIPILEAAQAGRETVFTFQRKGFVAKLTSECGCEAEVADSILRWAAGASRVQAGPLLRNDLEKFLTEAFGSFSEELGVCVNHHMPFGYAVGYRPDVPRQAARHGIELCLSLRPDVEASACVVLPIRVDAESSRDEESMALDRQMAEYVCAAGMPMAAVQPSDHGRYQLTYSLDGCADAELSLDDREAATKALRSLTEHALAATGKMSLVHEGASLR